MRKLTERQSQVYEFILKHFEAKGFPPTRKEIADAMGFNSINAAEDHLRALSRKGVISLKQGISRGIVLPDQGLPLVATYKTAKDLLHEDNVEEFIKIKPSMFKSRADFLIRVPDDSIKNFGIKGGDLLAIKQSIIATNGQLVVARIDQDNITVRRYHRDNNIVHLESGNREFIHERVNLDEQKFIIEGVAIGALKPSLD